MCRDVCKAMARYWQQQHYSLERMAENYLLDIKSEDVTLDFVIMLMYVNLVVRLRRSWR